MTAAATDIHRTVEYRTDCWFVGWLPYALLVALLGLYILIYGDSKARLAGLVLLAVGSSLAAGMLYRQFAMSRPRLVLSAAGLGMRVAMRDVLIPWREIESIATTDREVWVSSRGIPHQVTYRDCTMLRISQRFYREAIHVESIFLRGPGWDHLFIPKGNSVEIALHHEQFSTGPQDVRKPIEERWRKFRGRNHPAAQTEADLAEAATDAAQDAERPPEQPRSRSGAAASALGEPVRFGLPQPFLSTPRETIKLAIPLICLVVLLSNATGLWETAAQQERRLEREAEAEERRKEKAARDKWQKEWDDTWKRFDDDMRRVHGDFKR